MQSPSRPQIGPSSAGVSVAPSEQNEDGNRRDEVGHQQQADKWRGQQGLARPSTCQQEIASQHRQDQPGKGRKFNCWDQLFTARDNPRRAPNARQFAGDESNHCCSLTTAALRMHHSEAHFVVYWQQFRRVLIVRAPDQSPNPSVFCAMYCG